MSGIEYCHPAPTWVSFTNGIRPAAPQWLGNANLRTGRDRAAAPPTEGGLNMASYPRTTPVPFHGREAGYEAPASARSMSSRSLGGDMGRDWGRTPMASPIALAMAASVGTTGTSPTPRSP